MALWQFNANNAMQRSAKMQTVFVIVVGCNAVQILIPSLHHICINFALFAFFLRILRICFALFRIFWALTVNQGPKMKKRGETAKEKMQKV
jgi:hypothetical protein